MTTIKITACPTGFEHTLHASGFRVLDWNAGKPVIALHGTRQALSQQDGWRWQQGHDEYA